MAIQDKLYGDPAPGQPGIKNPPMVLEGGSVPFGAMMSLADEGIWIGPSEPTVKVTRATWESTKTGYWAWIPT